MIEKVEQLLRDVESVIKEFNLGDTDEDYIKAVHIVRYRRGQEQGLDRKRVGLAHEIQQVINHQTRKLQ